MKRAIEEHCPEITQVRQVKGAASAMTQTGFTSPFVETAAWTFALEFGSIPEGGIATVPIEGEALLFARNGGSVTCFHDACAHLGLPVSGGPVAGGHIRCPFHGFKYDLTTGECLTAPEVQLRQVAVRVAGPRVEVRLDTKLETRLGAK